MRTPDTDTTDTADGYVDLYLLPVPERHLNAYRRQAETFGRIVREHGALGYREFLADDVGSGFEAEAGSVLTAAVVDFRSRAHRDEVMALVMADARVVAAMEDDPLADMDRMRYGGFATFVRA